ncbi:MOSC domain-containing protein [Candidatus Aminicenantes bacterium AH-873-B07]|nr:MOSC domain-containing protein [Candidatus Aminicenantes bacterium AH-873-B07]
MENSNGKKGKIISVNISKKKNVRKRPIQKVKILSRFGLEGDVHAGNWHRQVSLLAVESIKKMKSKGLKVKPGDFGENITTQGINLISLSVGSVLKLGEKVLLEITQIGKVCHTKCAIYYQAGDCIMPKEGVFARVLEGGEIKVGDEIEILEDKNA